MTAIRGRRITLRPLKTADFSQWRAVRRSNVEWLTKWEPRRAPGHPDPVESSEAFSLRCNARERERQLGTGYGFGVFYGDNFVGEMNLSNVQRGPFQSGHVGYWIDEAHAGCGFCPEALLVLARFAFEDLRLHRIQISIIPRNTASRRVVEKLDVRNEGLAIGYLEINGNREDHYRYAITADDWQVQGPRWYATWLQ